MAPEDEKAASAAGRGHLRASHADRRCALETVKTAFVQGRLGQEEFELRMNRTFESRTYAELAALTADLPTAPVSAQPPAKPVAADDPARTPTVLGAGAFVLIWLGLLLIPGAFAVGVFPLMAVGVLCILVASPVAGDWALQTWRERRRGGPPPPPRAAPGGPVPGAGPGWPGGAVSGPRR